MDWSVLSSTAPTDLECDDDLLSEVFKFILGNDLPSHVSDPAHLLSVVYIVLRKKGVELTELEEEVGDLMDRHQLMEDNVGTSERELIEKIGDLEKELHSRQSLIKELQQRVGTTPPSTTTEIRRLRDELEDLRLEATKDKRLLTQEKAETERLVEELSVERLKVRQLERNLNELKLTVDDYHGQLQRSKVKGGGPAGNNYRQMMIEKEMEYSKLLDDFQLMSNSFEETKIEMKRLVDQLEAVEEERRILAEENQQIREALSQSDGRCEAVEGENKLLVGQVEDLQQRVREQSGADQQIITMVTNKAQEWESVLSAKQRELDECVGRVRELEGLLRVAQRQSDKSAMLNMKKRLQDQDGQLAALEKELSEATHTITILTDRLEGEGQVGVVNELEVKVQSRERELAMEAERRRTCEEESVERDKELNSLRKKIRDYEQGVTGLSEAVEAIKKKKEELTLRDNDIAELTRQVNLLSDQLNRLSEENEALRDQLGLGAGEQVNLLPLRLRKRNELEALKEEHKLLENEMECLKEDNLYLRKQLVQAQVANVQSNSSKGKIRLKSGRGQGQRSNVGGHTLVEGLQCRVTELESECDRERVVREEAQRDRDRLKKQLELIKFKTVQSTPPTQPTHSPSTTPHPHTSVPPPPPTSHPPSSTPPDHSRLQERLEQAEGRTHQLNKELRDKRTRVTSLEQEAQALKRSKVGFHPVTLPEGLSLTSSDVINSLNEHLLHVLSTLKQREQEVGVAQEALEKYQRKFSVIIHQQGILYQEYSEARKSWEAERDRLLHDNRQLAAYREQDQVQVQQLKALQDVLSSDPDEGRRKMGDLSRKATLLMVNERTLSRRLSLAQDAEKQLRKDNDHLRSDLVRLEKAATERIGHLQRHKDACLFQVSSLQSQLSESVPSSLLVQANREHRELAVRHQDLLQKQTVYTSNTATVEGLQAEVRTLTDQLESVKQDLLSEKHKNQLYQATASPADGPSGQGERLVTLEMKELNERQRGDLATTRCRQLQETLLQLEQRNSSLEDKFSDLSQRLLHSQTSEAELRDQLATALTQEEKTTLLSEISKLKESENQLKLENSQLKDVAEVARQQVAAMEAKQKSHDIELSSLRHQLIDLQVQSEDRTVLGKLHHQIVALQVSESRAVKSLEEARHKVSRLEACLLRCEGERDSLSERVTLVRGEGSRKTRQLRSTIQALRRQYAGCVPLVEQERYVELVGRVRADKLEAERMREVAKKKMEEAEDKLAELTLQHTNLQELLGALKDDPAHSAARLTEWHSKLGELRLKEMRTVRENERLHEKVKHLEDLLTKNEGSIERLERDLFQATKDHESAQESWLLREAELEGRLEEAKKEKKVTSDVPTKKLQVRPDCPTPPERHGDSVARKLFDHHETTPHTTPTRPPPPHATHYNTAHAITRPERDDLPTRLDKERTNQTREQTRLERALAEAQRVLLEREKEVSELRAHRMREGVEGGRGEGVDGGRVADMERQLEVVNETVEQLKSELSEKDRQVQRYQDLLQQARQELRDSAHTHKQELASLTAQLHTQTDSTVTRLREAALEIANIPPPNVVTDEQLVRLRELEDMCAERGREGARLTQQVEALKRELEAAMTTHESDVGRMREKMKELKGQHQREVKELQSSLEERSTRVSELEQELEVLEGELSAAQQAAKQAPSRSLKALVERLRGQLAIKEKQQRALSQALLQVRADLVETAQRTVEGESARERQEANVRVLVERRTTQLQERVDNLSQKMASLSAQLEESRAREAAKDEELTGQRHEIEEIRDQLRKMTGELEQKRRGLEQAKSRERKLASEIHQLHTHLEQRPPEVEELQKRVRILQGKLEREKSRTGEEIARLASQKGAGGRRGEQTSEITPQVDDKHRGAEVVRWEEGKKWQKKVETLRTRLTEKQRELEGAHKSLQALKDTLTRSDREKAILQNKLKTAQKSTTSAPPPVSKGGVSDVQFSPSERESLQSRVFQLEGEVVGLKRELVSGREGELYELRMRCDQLTRTVETLEEQLQQQHSDSEQLSPLRERERELREELLQSQRENMTLRFDYEQAVLELPRLRARLEDQCQYIEMLNRSEGGDNIRPHPGKKDGGQSAAELERVISAMRKVIERLQSENTSLKSRVRSSQNKVSALSRLEEENKRLKSEVETLSVIQSTPAGNKWSGGTTGLSSPYEKIVTENDRLRRDLKKDQDQINKFQVAMTTLKLENTKLRQELDSSTRPLNSTPHNHSCEERVERLQAELEKKTAMLMEVKKHLREAVDRERHIKSLSTDPTLSEQFLTVSREKELLEEQVTQLKKELDAFDPSFFEEIEDLKFNYQEAVKRNVQLEEQMRKLSQQHGFSLEPAENS